jgi:hypothetical protein
VRSDIGLDVFHQVLQSAFGWTDTHLHRFALGGSPFDRNTELFLCPYDVEEGEDDGVPAKDVRLDETLSDRTSRRRQIGGLACSRSTRTRRSAGSLRRGFRSDGRRSGLVSMRSGKERTWPVRPLRSSRSMPAMISSNRR